MREVGGRPRAKSKPFARGWWGGRARNQRYAGSESVEARAGWYDPVASRSRPGRRRRIIRPETREPSMTTDLLAAAIAAFALAASLLVVAIVLRQAAALERLRLLLEQTQAGI